MIDSVRRTIQRLYFEDDSRDSFLDRGLRGLLIPFVPLYRGARFLDQLRRVATRRKLSRPVVSVGNISIGGTGKTPFVKWLCSEMIDRGYKPAILKRGEGSREGVIGRGATDSNSSSYGDEVALLHEALPEVPIGVGANRYEQGQRLEKNHDVDLFVLDDGFQHRQLIRTVDIALLGSPRELDQWELPAGPLREPVSSLERADVISVNESGRDDADGWKEHLRELVGTREDRLVTAHRYCFQGVYVDGDEVTEDLRSQSRGVDLLTTLARPNRLVDFLEQQGISVDNHVQLPDHGAIDSSIFSDRLDPNNTLVTDKEWVKLSPDCRGIVGRVSSSLEVDAGDRILREVEALLDGDRS